MVDGQDVPAPTHRLDVIGYACPVPVAKTKEALSTLSDGHVLEVLADDPETFHDLPLVIGRARHRLVHVGENDGEFRFVIEVVT